MYPSIPDKLQSLYKDGYKLVCVLFLVSKLMKFYAKVVILVFDWHSHLFSCLGLHWLEIWLHQVIFTNESNIERWKNKRQVAVDSKIGRLNNFIEQVKVPIQVNSLWLTYIMSYVVTTSNRAMAISDPTNIFIISS